MCKNQCNLYICMHACSRHVPIDRIEAHACMHEVIDLHLFEQIECLCAQKSYSYIKLKILFIVRVCVPVHALVLVVGVGVSERVGVCVCAVLHGVRLHASWCVHGCVECGCVIGEWVCMLVCKECACPFACHVAT